MSAATRGHLVTLGLLLPALAFLAVLFLLPLARLLVLSFTSPEGAFAAYAELLSSGVYRRVFANTLTVAAVCTTLCLLLGYPIAAVLARLRGTWLALALYCVLFPLWISVLVRTFSWMLLLETNGPINRALTGLGIVDQPLRLLFNDTGVMIGMVHVLLPYAVLPIYAAILKIDGRLLQASDGLGASPWTTFRRVHLPLSMPGIAAAGSFVFLLSLGFFITPALLGGSNAMTLSMLIENLVNERLVWPLAAAASFVLLAATLLLLGVATRLLPFSQVVGAR